MPTRFASLVTSRGISLFWFKPTAFYKLENINKVETCTSQILRLIWHCALPDPRNWVLFGRSRYTEQVFVHLLYLAIKVWLITTAQASNCTPGFSWQFFSVFLSSSDFDQRWRLILHKKLLLWHSCTAGLGPTRSIQMLPKILTHWKICNCW